MPSRRKPSADQYRVSRETLASSLTMALTSEPVQMKKIQLSIYLDPEISRSLDTFANHRGQSKSLVAKAAIASFLSPDDSDRREAAIASSGSTESRASSNAWNATMV